MENRNEKKCWFTFWIKNFKNMRGKNVNSKMIWYFLLVIEEKKTKIKSKKEIDKKKRDPEEEWKDGERWIVIEKTATLQCFWRKPTPKAHPNQPLPASLLGMPSSQWSFCCCLPEDEMAERWYCSGLELCFL